MENGNCLDNVVVCITCELGRKEMSLKDIRQLREQDVIELDKLAGEPVEIRLNGQLFARGEVETTELRAVRVTDMVDAPQEVGS
jgi:flagellar motor switch protein FliN/FliY